MTRHLITLAAIAAVAACSAGVTSEAQLTSAPQIPEPELDGAPPVAAPLAPDAVVEAPPPSFARKQDESLWCNIAVTRTSNGVLITPVVRSDYKVSGDYSLVITKSGKSGSSDILQGGPFDAPRGVKHELGSSEISLERGASFRAVLKVRSGGHEVCREIRS